MTSIPKESGIYQIRCIPTGKIYIGSATNLIRRKSTHFRELKQQKHFNTHLQNAYNKYGKGQFIFEIVEICAKDVLIEREQYYLDNLNPDFNICSTAQSMLGYQHREDSKQKMSRSRMGCNNHFYGKCHSAKTKQIISRASSSRRHSAESKLKISEGVRGIHSPWYGKRLSIEHKQKLSKANSMPVIQLSLNGDVIATYPSIIEAYKITGTNRSNISGVCKGKLKTAGGFMWRYVNERHNT